MMRITHLSLSNWRNFKSVALDLHDRAFVFGPNASGKSNLLDAIRFLRDLTSTGGGLQQAVQDRGGVARVRNLAARNYNKSHVTLAVRLGDDDELDRWTYELTFTQEARGVRRPRVVRELVLEHGKTEPILDRPDQPDGEDPERLTQTALEQVIANVAFREIAVFLQSVSYLHLVPQVIREPDRGAEHAEDPFGGDFLSRVALTSARERQRRLRAINSALQLAVPQLEDLQLNQAKDGTPHLEARYKHWRQQGARQDETDFSDGTLRLIGLLWALQDRAKKGAAGPILLEEPEMSLHSEIVRQLPSIIARSAKSTGRQVLATTHAADLLADEGLGLDEVIVLTPSEEGTTARLARDVDGVRESVDSGFTIQEALAADLVPTSIRQLSFLPLS